MTNILLPAGIVILLLAANIVTLIVVLCRKRQRKSPVHFRHRDISSPYLT